MKRGNHFRNGGKPRCTAACIPAFPFNKLKVAAEDIDGEENGAYKDTSINIELTQKDFKGGDKSWFNGKVEKEVTIQMEEKSHE